LSVTWEAAYGVAVSRAKQRGCLVFAEFFEPGSIVSKQLETAYQDDNVAREINAHCAAVRVNALDHRDLTKRMRIHWTPTLVFLDAQAAEHHRFVGYLPPDEFGAQVHIARGREAFGRENYQTALDAYQTIAERFPQTDSAPEALYWTGVCRFKLSNDEARILDACRELVRRYPKHLWARKVGFLLGE
jgi:hypothetical protein